MCNMFLQMRSRGWSGGRENAAGDLRSWWLTSKVRAASLWVEFYLSHSLTPLSLVWCKFIVIIAKNEMFKRSRKPLQLLAPSTYANVSWYRLKIEVNIDKLMTNYFLHYQKLSRSGSWIVLQVLQTLCYVILIAFIIAITINNFSLNLIFYITSNFPLSASIWFAVRTTNLN